MSHIYITEPGTEGKVLLHTSFGDIDVELWPQQAPKACRNFVQLCLEGYYDNTIFHRIIAGFMVQGGDPTGTGTGGESIYGAPFIDEFHSRLRFNHRGLLAMANSNAPNTNASQFFFTLDACEFLDRKHTIFGKITGNTIFNLLSIKDVETDAQDRPIAPPKLLSVEVLWNPFDDILPRDIRPVQPTASTTADDAARKKKRERKATKDLSLLSFGDDEFASSASTTKRSNKKTKTTISSSHELLDDAQLKKDTDAHVLDAIAAALPTTATQRDQVDATTALAKKDAVRMRLKAAAAATSLPVVSTASTSPDAAAVAGIGRSSSSSSSVNNAPSTAAQDEYARLRNELKATKKAAPLARSTHSSVASKPDDMLTPLQQQRQKYLAQKRANNRSGRQEATLEKLAAFKATLESANRTVAASAGKPSSSRDAYHGQVLECSDDDKDDERDGNEQSWMTAKLKFQKHLDDHFRAGNDPAIDNYMTIDTRNERPSSGINTSSSSSRRRADDRSRRDDRSRDSRSRDDRSGDDRRRRR